MLSEIEVSVYSMCLAICLVCGFMIWFRRGEVTDRSRTYLAIMDLVSAAIIVLFIIYIILGSQTLSSVIILDPYLCIGGLYAITLFMLYPIEVMRPRQLMGRWILFMFLPSFLVTLPVLFGLRFQTLYSWADLTEHLFDFDVLLRLLAIAFLTVFSILIFFIPYNWRRSSADYHWIRRVAILAQGISVLFYCNVFTGYHVFSVLHIVWAIFTILYFTYYELSIRLLPPANPELKPSLKESPVKEEPAPAAECAAQVSDDWWPLICQVMDVWESWRNPNTTVDTVSAAVGTNRIYVARCIREHTGKTFNDYMNEKRIACMASQLRLDPKQDHKHLYFDVGFRSRHTAYRNFVKFQGCSPTDFIASLS